MIWDWNTLNSTDEFEHGRMTQCWKGNQRIGINNLDFYTSVNINLLNKVKQKNVFKNIITNKKQKNLF